MGALATARLLNPVLSLSVAVFLTTNRDSLNFLLMSEVLLLTILSFSFGGPMC